MATLFDQTKQNISLHINNCFREKDGKKYKTKFYKLDVIISVGTVKCFVIPIYRNE